MNIVIDVMKKKNILRLLRIYVFLFFFKCVYKVEKKNKFFFIDRKIGRWGRRVVCGYKLFIEDYREILDCLFRRGG